MGADVLVIGAGVAGLTTALHLAEQRRRVRVIAARPPEETTSANAGASWAPFMVDDSRSMAWSRATLLRLRELSAHPGSGVRLVNGIDASTDAAEAPPNWASEIEDFRMCRPDELPPGYGTGWRYTIPIVDMPTYLNYLVARLKTYDVEVEVVKPVTSFSTVRRRPGEAIVNCTGIGARDLVPDDTVTPIRGQLVVVPNNGITEYFQDTHEGADLIYILPHDRHVVLGGCAVKGSTSLKPDAQVAEEIRDRCAAIEPRLRGAPIADIRVGVRPARESVCLERSEIDGVSVVHNYGHGGAGLTLSWGCAAEIGRLVG